MSAQGVYGVGSGIPVDGHVYDLVGVRDLALDGPSWSELGIEDGRYGVLWDHAYDLDSQVSSLFPGIIPWNHPEKGHRRVPSRL